MEEGVTNCEEERFYDKGYDYQDYDCYPSAAYDRGMEEGVTKWRKIDRNINGIQRERMIGRVNQNLND